jgi:hypothetical protein
MPIWLPSTHVRAGQSVFVWGQARLSDRLGSQSIEIQWHPSKGKWKTLTVAHTGSHTGYFTANVRVPSSGYVRTHWVTAHAAFSSRLVPVIVAR